jgi:hypothetical protein
VLNFGKGAKKLGPQVTVDLRKEFDGRESLWGAEVKLADVLVHNPQFTNVIDIVGMGDQ